MANFMGPNNIGETDANNGKNFEGCVEKQRGEIDRASNKKDEKYPS